MAGELTHLAAAKPAAPTNAQCKDLSKTHTPDAQQLAHVLRRLTCEPGLFFKPVKQVRKELALKAGYELIFSGPATATLRFEKSPTPNEFRHVIGSEKLVARMSDRGAWRSRVWFLGTDAKTGAFDVWGPGKAMIGVKVDYSSLPKDTKVTPLKEDTTFKGSAVITMPQSVVPVKHDEVAVKLLVAALGKLSADRKLLSNTPSDIAKRTALTGERFRISARSIGSARSGTDLWTQRTRIDSDAVIKALGLKGKIDHRQARDADDYLLFDGADTEHKYKGLTLELSFDKRDGKRFELSGVTVK